MDDEKQFEMFQAPRRPKGKRKKKVMTPEHRLLIETYNRYPSLTVNRAPRSMQKGHSDTPLFMNRNQADLFLNK